jgi:hypothetical protein
MRVTVPSLELSKEVVQNAIQEACDLANSRWSYGDKMVERDFVKFRLGNLDNVSNLKSSMVTSLDLKKNVSDNIVRDIGFQVHLIIAESFAGNVIGSVALYWTYSSWDGLYIYAKNLKADSDSIEASLIYTLAEIALRCEGRRIVWQVQCF